MDDLDQFVQSDLLYTQERMSRYRPGGFHPGKLGDIFKSGRYKVYHKLGYGGFSTVWLAIDQSLKRWVSLKIVTATSTESSRELTVLRKLKDAGVGHVVQLLDSFVHQGPDGTHAYLVFELLGPTVDHVVSDYRDDEEPDEEGHLKPATILKITGQLLRALAAMHRAGYAHGVIQAYISGANLVFTAHKLRKLSAKEMFEVIGAPVTEQLVRCDRKPHHRSMPQQLVQKAGWDMWIDEDKEDVRLIDFGEAFAHGAEHHQLAEPPGLEVPERIFTGRFDYRVDLWRAGCLARHPFHTGAMDQDAKAVPFQSLGDVDVVVAQMIHFVEDLPVAWRRQWEARRHNAGKDLLRQWQGPSKLEAKFRTRVKDTSLRRLLPIIQGLMRFQPETRISAEQALGMLQ
ncbi:kinase-like domain-containing protein [Chaetomium strumarium]|uniref:non-specific serine/threonine protein kinase n=1 Tax=Chaetomium strumarium TaxID=1170767 RepID=A0AAJ0GS58_9PEZI|nr:kinase-like domain-containing protein [Chaetomium strumarium]